MEKKENTECNGRKKDLDWGVGAQQQQPASAAS